MFTPKFKVSSDERLYLSPKYICNGHWLFERNFASTKFALKPLQDLTRIKEGVYPSGIKAGEAVGEFPDFNAVIPKRDGYIKAEPAPSRVEFSNETDVSGYVYNFGDQEFCIDVKYVQLLKMGTVFAKEPRSALLILSGDSLNDNLIGVVMPRRMQ